MRLLFRLKVLRPVMVDLWPVFFIEHWLHVLVSTCGTFLLLFCFVSFLHTYEPIRGLFWDVIDSKEICSLIGRSQKCDFTTRFDVACSKSLRSYFTLAMLSLGISLCNTRHSVHFRLNFVFSGELVLELLVRLGRTAS